jgi:hypothetical protein
MWALCPTSRQVSLIPASAGNVSTSSGFLVDVAVANVNDSKRPTAERELEGQRHSVSSALGPDGLVEDIAPSYVPCDWQRAPNAAKSSSYD